MQLICLPSTSGYSNKTRGDNSRLYSTRVWLPRRTLLIKYFGKGQRNRENTLTRLKAKLKTSADRPQFNTRKTAGRAENPAANKLPYVTSNLHAIVTLYIFTIHRHVIEPLGLLFGHLDIFLLSLTIRPKF